MDIQNLQMYQKTCKWLSNISSTLYDLQWLLVQQHIEYKLCSLVSKCLRYTALSYLEGVPMCRQQLVVMVFTLQPAVT